MGAVLPSHSIDFFIVQVHSNFTQEVSTKNHIIVARMIKDQQVMFVNLFLPKAGRRIPLIDTDPKGA